MASSARALSFAPAAASVSPQPSETRTRRLWLCAHFPELALEVLNLDPVRPAAAVEEGPGRACLYAVSEAARRAGVEPGMAVAAALVLCPDLLLKSRDAAAERSALEKLADAGLEFTPWASLAPPDQVRLEIGASLRLFGGTASLRERLRGRLLNLGHRAVLALAPTCAAAGLLARLGLETLVEDHRALRSVLGRVPVAALPWDGKTLRRLQKTGLLRLADVWRLPREGLARRYGPEFLAGLDALAGTEARPPEAYHRPPRFSARRDLPMELERLDHLFPAIASLAGEFAVFLKARDAAALGLKLDLFHRDLPATRLELGFRSAHRDTGHWLKLLREKLERTPLPAPVAALALRSEAIVPFRPERRDLFDAGASHPDADRDWHAVLEQLQARLGPHTLKRLGTGADHRPECAQTRRASPPNPPPGLPARPLWLLAVPEPVDLAGLRLLSEPERIESGWWDDASVRRDYHRALDSQGRELWIFRDLKNDGRWYLHGLFG